MRYGRPDIAGGVQALLDRGVDRIRLVALYPQHADSTRETTIRAVLKHLPEGVALDVQPPFYAEDYLQAQAELIRAHLPERWDHLLLSYHGLPERHLQKADPTGNHCLKRDDCCQVPSPAHATCYRHQVMVTSERLRERLELEEEQMSVSFQSRLGRLPWLEPYTDLVLEELPGRGVKRLVVACPAFVADNLGTLEEIGMAGRETFLSAGGDAFTLVPCLNAEPAWVKVLADWCRRQPA